MPDSTTRADGREWNQIRPMDAEQSVLVRADGSVRYSIGLTTVIASVHGPKEVGLRNENIEKTHLEVSILGRKGKDTNQEDPVFIKQIVDSIVLTGLHPRTSISVTLQVLNDDGSLLSAVTTATMIALLDAGVAMKGVFAAVTCALTENGVVVDPTREEEKNADCVCSMCFSTVAPGLVASRIDGVVGERGYEQCLNLCRTSFHNVVSFIRLAMSARQGQ